MPRKVDPRWAEDGYGEDGVVEPLRLSAADAHAIATVPGLAADQDRIERIRAGVEAVGTQYRRWHGRGAGAFSRAEARKALEALLRRDVVDCAAYWGLNERAQQCVLDALLQTKPAPVSAGDTVVRAMTENRIPEPVLREAVRAAIVELEEQKGPDLRGDLAWAVAALCDLYEAVTDRCATLSNKIEHMAYAADPQSEAGRFVQACVRHIDPRVTGASISRAMRDHIERRHRRSRL